jgi:hypothetical protein
MKKYFLSVFAIVLAISFSAFTNMKPVKQTDNAFWYNIDPSTNEVLNEYGFVSRESAQTSSGCSGAGTLCDKWYSTDMYNVGDFATQPTSLNIRHN